MKNVTKLLIAGFLTLILTTGTATAQTAITGEIAQKYYSNCMAGAAREGTMTSDTSNQYCTCTATHMQQSMTQEDLIALSAQGAPARAALNKILTDVNGPCMQFPVHDLIAKKCMTDLKNAAVCNCLSTKMAEYTAAESQKMMPQLLAQDPNIVDPLSPIMDSDQFQSTQKSIALSCAMNPN